MDFPTISQRVLSQSMNIGYLVRGVARVKTIPENRKADYLFRDFYMSILTAYFVELAFRAAESAYTVPLTKRLLNLEQLGYKKFPPVLTQRMLGSLVKPGENYLLPGLLEKEHPLLAKEFLKHIDYTQYLKKYESALSPEEKTLVLNTLKKIQEGVQEHLNAGLKDKVFLKKLINPQAHPELIEAIENKLLPNLATEIPEHLLPQVKKGIQGGLQSALVQKALQKVQGSATWPKMLASAGINFLYFGVAGNWFDVKVLQPWQKRLVAERGTAAEVVGPAYLAMVPALLSLGLSKTGPLKNLGYVSKFASVGAIGVTTYTAAAYLLIKARLAGKLPFFKDLSRPVAKPLPATIPTPKFNTQQQSSNPSSSSSMSLPPELMQLLMAPPSPPSQGMPNQQAASPSNLPNPWLTQQRLT